MKSIAPVVKQRKDWGWGLGAGAQLLASSRAMHGRTLRNDTCPHEVGGSRAGKNVINLRALGRSNQQDL